MINEPPPILRVTPHAPEPDAVRRAADALRAGELVLLPTDTVYGVAGDASAPAICARIAEAKGRPSDKPIPLLAAGLADVRRFGARLDVTARRLAAAHWPGPLTLVLSTGAGAEGFRVPDHPVTLAVLRAVGGVLRVTSANRSGEPPALTAGEAVRALGAHVALCLDAGPAPVGEASTVADLSGGDLRILRQGAIPAASLLALAEREPPAGGRALLFVCAGNVCRSPMAEYLLRHRMGPRTRWRIGSAGACAFPGQPASANAVAALSELGIDASGHRSRPLTAELVDAATVVVVMTETQRAQVVALSPEAAEKVFLLKSFDAEGGGDDVEDPIGRPLPAYRKVMSEIDGALPDLILYLYEHYGV